MALIVQAGDPVLRSPARPVPAEKLGTPELEGLVAEMVATMRAAPGVGLAAPQIGVPWQLLVAEDDTERMSHLSPEGRDVRERVPLPLLAIVNPELRPVGDAVATHFEGCLSVSGWTALVTRAVEVEVTGFTPKGDPLKLQLHGWPARILQHEIDHLRGTLYIDRMYSRSFARADSAQKWADRPVESVVEQLGIKLTR
jgi:peptide deformylase